MKLIVFVLIFLKLFCASSVFNLKRYDNSREKIFSSRRSNGVAYVSANSTADESSCGSNFETACKTVVSGCIHGMGRGEQGVIAEVMVSAGEYIETSEVAIQNIVRINGSSNTECLLSKKNNSTFVLFLLNMSGSLTITNMTLLVSNHTDNSPEIMVNGSSNVYVVLRSCVITIASQNARSGVYGHFINNVNSESIVGLEFCTVSNFTTINNYTYNLIMCDCSEVNISNSSFIGLHDNVQFLHVELKQQTGRFSLIQSVFVDCNVVHISGQPICTISSCTFLNATSASGGSVFIIEAENNVRVTNTSFIHCNSTGSGGVFLLNTKKATPQLTDCAFVRCSSNSSGGAIYFHNCSAALSRCLFMQCGARKGGALYSVNANVTLSDCVFLGNFASDGKDFSFESECVIHLTSVYTDQPSNTTSIAKNSWVTKRSGSQDLLLKKDYDAKTCDNMFSSAAPSIGECPGLCVMDKRPYLNTAANTFTPVCVKPDACPADTHIAVLGKCVPTCTFVPNNGSCPGLCEPDYSLGAPLCTACVNTNKDPYRCARIWCEAVSLVACAETAGCVVTEEDIGYEHCSTTCTDPSRYAVSAETDTTSLLYRKCVRNSEQEKKRLSKGGLVAVIVAVSVVGAAVVVVAVVVLVIVLLRRKAKSQEEWQAQANTVRSKWQGQDGTTGGGVLYDQQVDK